MDEENFDIDLNKLPNEEEMIVQFQWNSFELSEYPKEIGGLVREDSMKNEFDPFVGQCFLGEEEAFICYKK